MNVSNVLQVAAGFTWLILIGAIFFIGLSSARGRPIKGAIGIVLTIVVIALVLTTVSAGLVFIQPDERGVVISAISPKGYRELALTPGLRWVIPYFESTVLYPISRQTYTMSAVSGEGQIQGDDSIITRTADGQQVRIDASIIYAIDPEKVINVHIQWQNRFINDLIRPLARGVIRDTISQYRVDQVYSTKRAEVASLISDKISMKLSENGLILFDFVLRDIAFSPEYAASVEQKQIAEQQAQQAKFVVESRKQEAEQARQVAQGKADSSVIQAEGGAKSRRIQSIAEAEALRVIGETLKDQPDLLTYQYISSLAPGIQVMLVPNNNPFILPIPSLKANNETITKTPEPSPTPTVVIEPSPTAVK